MLLALLMLLLHLTRMRHEQHPQLVLARAECREEMRKLLKGITKENVKSVHLLLHFTSPPWFSSSCASFSLPLALHRCL